MTKTVTIPAYTASELMKINHATYIHARNAWLESANAPTLELKNAIDYIRFARFGHDLCKLSRHFPLLLQESDIVQKHVRSLELSTKILCTKGSFLFIRDNLVKLLENELIGRVVYERDFIRLSQDELFSICGDNVKTLGGV